MKMKRTGVILLSLCMAFAFITGCKKQFTTTLHGTLFNAITGERIGGTDVRWHLRLGTTTRDKPDLFYTGAANTGTTSTDLMGDYAFNNIPSMDSLSTGSTDILPNEYRLTVIKDGFQRFEGIIDQDMLANQDVVIRNIYLFPEDSIPCYTYTATFNGKPVPGATIAASPYATLNPGIIATDKWLSIDLGTVADEYSPILGAALDVATLFNNNYFFPSPGYLANISKTTDANGQVSFCSTDGIVAGGAYAVSINMAAKFEGVQLDTPMYKLLIAGYSDSEQLFELETKKSTGNDYGLYVTAISNSVQDQYDSTGTLTITFNRAVTLTTGTNTPYGFIATDNSPISKFNATDPVNESLSADGLTLTLKPKWLTAPGTGELGIAITYTDGSAFVSPVGYPDAVIDVFNLENVAGDTISGKVNLSAPVPDSLYVTDISNSDSTVLTANGWLTISLSTPVTLHTGSTTPFGCTATENSALGTLSATNPVFESIDGSNMVLTLKPNWTVPPGIAETGDTITYADGDTYLSLPGYPDSKIAIFNLFDYDARAITGLVKMN